MISTDGSPAQLSVDVAIKEIGASGGVMVAGALHWMSGGVVSTISTVCTQLFVFPQLSVAVQVLVIVSSSGHEPVATESE